MDALQGCDTGDSMQEPRRLVIIAQERAFDEERWKELLTTLAYLLHERRKAATTPRPNDEDESAGASHDRATP